MMTMTVMKQGQQTDKTSGRQPCWERCHSYGRTNHESSYGNVDVYVEDDIDDDDDAADDVGDGEDNDDDNESGPPSNRVDLLFCRVVTSR